MKVLLIHNSYQSNNIGGEDIVFQNELKSLQNKLGRHNVFSYQCSNDGISKFKLLFTIWFSFKHYRKVKTLIKKNTIDLVHVHNYFPLLTPSIFKAASSLNTKVVHTFHNYRMFCISGILYRDNHGICETCTKNKFSLAGILNSCYRNSTTQSSLAQMAFWFYRSIGAFNKIDRFFVLTNFQKEKIKQLGIDENKITLKPNSVGNFIKNNKEKKNYIYVGRLEESKGVFKLLDIWKQLDEKFVLTIIGNVEREFKRKHEKTNIIFKGKCSREVTLDMISCSKYLIQPSLLYETFGLTIIEAMSFGVPVIGFNIGTRKDFIQDRENGFLSGDDNLKEVIEKSFDYDSYSILSQGAVKTAKFFQNDYVIEQQIDIYRDIISK